VIGKVTIGGIDIGIVEIGLVNAAFEIVHHQVRGDPAPPVFSTTKRIDTNPGPALKLRSEKVRGAFGRQTVEDIPWKLNEIRHRMRRSGSGRDP
jgi:hypothetical protein